MCTKCDCVCSPRNVNGSGDTGFEIGKDDEWGGHIDVPPVVIG